MRRYTFASALVALSLLSACERNPPDAPATVATPTPAQATATPPAADTAAPVAAPTVAKWGPHSTAAGVAFNAQADGQSSLWIQANGRLFTRGTVVTFDGKPVDNVTVTPAGDLMTMLIPADYIATPGMKPVVLRIGGTQELVVGDFEVTQ